MKRNYSLDVIKLFLAYVIVLFHDDVWVPPGPTVTVQIFFVISGYFLARKYYGSSHNDPEKHYGAWQYTLDHVRSLYPHYLLAAGLFLGYVLLRALLGFVQSPGWSGLWEMAVLIYDQLPDVLFLQSSYQYGANLNMPTWQLSAMILGGYFVYALLCQNEKRARTILFPAAILMIQSLLSTGQDLFSAYGFFYMPLLRAFAPMCAGVLTYYFSTTEYYSAFRNRRVLFNVLALSALPAMMLFEDRNALHLLWSGLLVLGCMEPDTWLNRLLNRKCFAGCGKLSYVIYLNHALLGRFHENIVKPLLVRLGADMSPVLDRGVYLAMLTVFCLVLQWMMGYVCRSRIKTAV